MSKKMMKGFICLLLSLIIINHSLPVTTVFAETSSVVN